MDNNVLVETNPLFEEIAREQDFHSPELMQLVAKTGSVAEIEDVPEKYRKIFVTAHDMSPEWHIRHTGRLPEVHGQRRVQDRELSAYRNHWRTSSRSTGWRYKLGCKGVTVYRDGSRDSQVLEIQRDKEEQVLPKRPPATWGRGPARKSPGARPAR